MRNKVFSEIFEAINSYDANYKKIKDNYPDTILFLEWGFMKCSSMMLIASRELEIALTSRDKTGRCGTWPVCPIILRKTIFPGF